VTWVLAESPAPGAPLLQKPGRALGEGFSMAAIPLNVNALAIPLDEKFILAYGEALLEWSYVENRLFRWFRHLTKLDDVMSRAIFFSARSFQGRSDMLAATIPHASFSGLKGPVARQIIEETLKKADVYSAFRNSLAHGSVIAEYSENGRREVLVQGKHPPHLQSETGIEIGKIKIAGENFAELSNALSFSLRMYSIANRPKARLRQLRECHERLLLLPNEPESATPSQKQLGRLRQRQSDARRTARN
jgi:hypothetical protein